MRKHTPPPAMDGQQLLALAKRIARAAEVFYQRYWYEQKLKRQDQELRFEVRWDDLVAAAERLDDEPFAALMERLAAVAEQDDETAARLFASAKRPKKLRPPAAPST
ncbi:MAG: hypothetical protein HYY50_00155 [Candidatus Kerfeldbacteria bacterium]|nr:hypothetical protein [Candidatus Kerfeldbacteria bacterium]